MRKKARHTKLELSTESSFFGLRAKLLLIETACNRLNESNIQDSSCLSGSTVFASDGIAHVVALALNDLKAIEKIIADSF
ncbi:hypothetical protein BegalDRAFT_3564 [Beggiatoa alba B18LD]|uniref:Uncharacterized protein n=1 Tax=Beggiatoa alba B18LD TaxID=395493 RepID=I3CBD7_9GAMM|nr:hypothetical protein [Beggiatoa alba]EIJ40930.1 hypothetical protein BegalDRAFT_3564 [Beggiatoa alba B18LD]